MAEQAKQQEPPPPPQYKFERPPSYRRSVFNPAKIVSSQYANVPNTDQAREWIRNRRESGEFYQELKDNEALYQGHRFVYKRDENEPGWGSGMDDLARILLDNKSVVKFNKKLITLKGALYWVQEKNKKQPEGKKWKVVVDDVNKDGVPEVLILDARNNIRYLNGFHVGKKNLDVVKAHQEYIDEKGNPSEIAMQRLQGKIKQGDLSIAKFIDDNTELDKSNPDGPLIVKGKLADIGYKTRPLNPCNLFLKYVTKPNFESCFTKYFEDPEHAKGATELYMKIVKREASIIKLNGYLYTRYVANPVYNKLHNQGLSDKAMRKKYPGRYASKYSEECAKQVEVITENDVLWAEIGVIITKAISDAAARVSKSITKGDPYKRVDHRAKHDDFQFSAWVNTLDPGK